MENSGKIVQKQMSFFFCSSCKGVLFSSKCLYPFQIWPLVESLFYIIDFFGRETLDDMSNVYCRHLFFSESKSC